MQDIRINLGEFIVSAYQNFLIIDDDESFRMLLKKYLRDIGFVGKVLEASDFNETKKVLKYEKVDFIFCDWNLPDHNGGSLLKALRKSNKYNHIPFVMASALQDDEAMVLNDELGGDEYLIKPINVDIVKEKLQIAWEKHTLETEGDVHRLLLRINELEQENSFLEERLRQVKNSISL